MLLQVKGSLRVFEGNEHIVGRPHLVEVLVLELSQLALNLLLLRLIAGLQSPCMRIQLFIQDLVVEAEDDVVDLEFRVIGRGVSSHEVLFDFPNHYRCQGLNQNSLLACLALKLVSKLLIELARKASLCSVVVNSYNIELALLLH